MSSFHPDVPKPYPVLPIQRGVGLDARIYLHHIVDTSRLVLRTLGPEGTSSDYCARSITRNGPLSCRQVVLHASFEEALAMAEEDMGSAVLVPNAYTGISDFYMSLRLVLFGSLLLDTPPYGIAAKFDSDVATCARDKGSLRVSTHPAPARLVRQLLPDSISVDLVTAASTVDAAAKVVAGQADLCLSNANAIQDHGLRPITPLRPITMLWSIFTPVPGAPLPPDSSPENRHP